MIKSEMVKALAAKENISEIDARKAIDAVLSLISDTLSNGENVLLSGFGKFEVSKKKEHNKILNNMIINVPEKYRVTFSLSREMKSKEMNTKKDNGLQELLSNIRID